MTALIRMLREPETAPAPVEAVPAVDPRYAEMPLFMSPAALAEVLAVTVNTLERWRRTKTGPAWKKFPGSNLIRYPRASVIEWLDGLEGSEDAS